MGNYINEIEKKAGPNVLITGHRCYRCGYEWRPNNLKGIPRVCPKCKNPYWDIPRRKSSNKKGEKHIKNAAK